VLDEAEIDLVPRPLEKRPPDLQRLGQVAQVVSMLILLIQL
jgi:hypothetical protein